MSVFSPGVKDPVSPVERAVMRRVSPARGTAEAIGVLAALVAIAIVLAIRAALITAPDADRRLMPYQRLDSGLSTDEQTLFRTLLAAEYDVVDLRGRSGFWPDTGALADAFVPPFDAALVPPALQPYQWTAHDGGSWVDYVGRWTLANGETPAFLLRLIDLHAGYHPHPHPGADYDPEKLVAVQVWTHPEAAPSYPGERLPEAGWSWVLRRDDPRLTRQMAPTAPDAPDAASPEQWFLEPPATLSE